MVELIVSMNWESVGQIATYGWKIIHDFQSDS